MHWAIPILSAGLAALLVWAAWGDLRRRDIPNPLTLAIALGAPLWWWATGVSIWPGMALQVGSALAIFLLFATLFAMGAMGGGDVKLIAALALWLPLGPQLRMLTVMAIAGGAVTIATLAWHRWRRAGGQVEVPYGVAISIAGLWVLANDILTISDH